MAENIMTGIDKTQVRSGFGRAADSYDTLATFQHGVCERLMMQLPKEMAPTRILDGGCGTGYGSDLLHRRWPSARLIGCDLAPEMVRKTHERGFEATCGDLEHLPFGESCFDLAWSSLALQWCDPMRSYAELHRVLTPSGTLACTTLTTGTLQELDAAFSGIDSFQRVLRFHPPGIIQNALEAAGFTDIRIVPETFITRHADFRSLLQTIRGIGAGKTGDNRRRALMGKHAWRTAQTRYETWRDESGLPLTYNVLFLFARKN